MPDRARRAPASARFFRARNLPYARCLSAAAAAASGAVVFLLSAAAMAPMMLVMLVVAARGLRLVLQRSF